jgi:hypothetical protein
MILLNFSHPLIPEQVQRIGELSGQLVERVIDIPTQFDHDQPFVEQVAELVNGIELSSVEWQTRSLIVNPPGYAPAAVALLAELHGRIGHFPAVLRLRPVAESIPLRYEVAEVIDLQVVRDEARRRRR